FLPTLAVVFQGVRHVLIHCFLVMQVVEYDGIYLFQGQCPETTSNLFRSTLAVNVFIENVLNPDAVAFDLDLVGSKEIKIVFKVHDATSKFFCSGLLSKYSNSHGR